MVPRALLSYVFFISYIQKTIYYTNEIFMYLDIDFVSRYPLKRQTTYTKWK